MNRYFIQNSNIILRNILNKEENLDIVKDFIEAILNIKIKEIKLQPYLGEKVKYLPKEEKYGIVNVRIINQDNEPCNVGIQIIDGFYAQEKILIYGASIHVNQEEYDGFEKVGDTYTINILNNKVFSISTCHKIITLSAIDSEGNVKTSDDLKFHVLQLPDYNNDEIKTHEDEWITYLIGDKEEQLEEIKTNNKYIRKLDKILFELWKNETI